VINHYLSNVSKVVLLLLILTNRSVFAQEDLTLHDSLNAALETQSNQIIMDNSEYIGSNAYLSWLDGVPSVSITHLSGQDSLGSNESEISLNLPIKSRFLKQIEQKLQSNMVSLRSAANSQFSLYLSGIIRDLAWAIRLENVRLQTLASKQALLGSLASQYTSMVNASAIPQYLMLIVTSELKQLKINELSHQQNIVKLQNKYKRLTGLHTLPTDIEEALPVTSAIALEQHPDVLALDAEFENAVQQLLGTSKKSSPWQIQVTGRRIDSPGFSENQLGIGIEIPISIGESLTSTQQSAYSKMNIDYDISKRKLLHNLRELLADLHQEFSYLQQKQSLLNSSASTLQSLTEAMQNLRAANATDQEFYIRTLLSTLDSQQELALNLTFIQRQKALIRQSAGISL